MEAHQKFQDKPESHNSVLIVSICLLVYSFILILYSIFIWYLKNYTWGYDGFYSYGIYQCYQTYTDTSSKKIDDSRI